MAKNWNDLTKLQQLWFRARAMYYSRSWNFDDLDLRSMLLDQASQLAHMMHDQEFAEVNTLWCVIWQFKA